METIFDNARARSALTAIAEGGGPSARVCRVLLASADATWEGRLECALSDAHDGVADHAALTREGITIRQVIAFVARLPRAFGLRPATAEEIASAEKARLAEVAAHADRLARAGRRVGQSEPQPPDPEAPAPGGNYSPATGDGLRDAYTWAREAYSCGDSLTDES